MTDKCYIDIEFIILKNSFMMKRESNLQYYSYIKLWSFMFTL